MSSPLRKREIALSGSSKILEVVLGENFSEESWSFFFKRRLMLFRACGHSKKHHSPKAFLFSPSAWTQVRFCEVHFGWSRWAWRRCGSQMSALHLNVFRDLLPFRNWATLSRRVGFSGLGTSSSNCLPSTTVCWYLPNTHSRNATQSSMEMLESTTKFSHIMSWTLHGTFRVCRGFLSSEPYQLPYHLCHHASMHCQGRCMKTSFDRTFRMQQKSKRARLWKFWLSVLVNFDSSVGIWSRWLLGIRFQRKKQFKNQLKLSLHRLRLLRASFRCREAGKCFQHRHRF